MARRWANRRIWIAGATGMEARARHEARLVGRVGLARTASVFVMMGQTRPIWLELLMLNLHEDRKNQYIGAQDEAVTRTRGAGVAVRGGRLKRVHAFRRSRAKRRRVI